MPKSIKHLLDAGWISTAQAAKLKGSRPQPSRMAYMHEDNGYDGDPPAGAIGPDHINNPKYGRTGLPSRGATSRGNVVPGVNHLRQRSLQGPKHPPQTVPRRQRLKTPEHAKGTAVRSAPMYEGSTAKPRAY